MKDATIIVFDDGVEQTNRIEELLIKDGYNVLRVRSLTQASKAAYQTKPDLIIVDLADSEAIKICKDLRSNAETCLSEILVLFEKIDDELKKQTIEIGIEEVVDRNISVETFLEKVHELLKHKE